MTTKQREARAFEAGARWYAWDRNRLPVSEWRLRRIRAEARRRYGKKARKP